MEMFRPNQDVREVFFDIVSKLEKIRDILIDDTDINPSNKIGYKKFKQDELEAGCIQLASGLNKLFSDHICRRAHVSLNTDNEFYGMYVRPSKSSNINLHSNILGLRGDGIDDYDKFFNQWFREYEVDIDATLFTKHAVSPKDAALLIIYDLDKIFSKDVYIGTIGATDYIRSYFKPNFKGNSDYCSLCVYVITEYVYRANSVFVKPMDECAFPTELIRNLDTDSEFDNAVSNMQRINSSVSCMAYPKSLILNWFYRFISQIIEYQNLHRKYFKSVICRGLDDVEKSTGAELIKSLIIKIKDDLIFKYTYTGNGYSSRVSMVTESKGRGFIKQMKFNGMKSLEDDLFEYVMRAKNIEDENSAILLMRQINSRMDIIYEYLENEGDKIPEVERKRWEKLYDKYDNVRTEMTKKPIYSRKMYGLYVDYAALAKPNDPQNMMMNTLY